MIDEDSVSINLMSNIVYIAQRANTNTCDVAARTIVRQAIQFVNRYPEKIKNLGKFKSTIRDLCECLLTLHTEVSGTGEEILIKRNALDLLLLISGELVYPKIDMDIADDEPEFGIKQYA